MKGVWNCKKDIYKLYSCIFIRGITIKYVTLLEGSLINKQLQRQLLGCSVSIIFFNWLKYNSNHYKITRVTCVVCFVASRSLLIYTFNQLAHYFVPLTPNPWHHFSFQTFYDTDWQNIFKFHWCRICSYFFKHSVKFQNLCCNVIIYKTNQYNVIQYWDALDCIWNVE